MKYLIRKARIADVYKIAKVHVETWQSHYRGQLPDDYLDKLSIEQKVEKWKENLRNQKPKTAFFVAESSGNILGFCGIGPSRDIGIPKTIGELYTLHLIPKKQGMGIGSVLMKNGLDYLKKEGFHKATLWVLKSNISTIKFYESKGWRADGEEKKVEKDGALFELIRYFIVM